LRGLTWIGYLLAADPERQQRLREEIVANGLGQPDAPLCACASGSISP
jgi:hypothetical protein